LALQPAVAAPKRCPLIGDAGPRAKRAPPTKASRLRFDCVTAINRAANLFNQGIRSVHEIRRAAPPAAERDRLAYELEALRKQFKRGLAELSEALPPITMDDVWEG
jgi:hypothetical protein